jgi:hypothetical protein
MEQAVCLPWAGEERTETHRGVVAGSKVLR